MWIWTDWTEQLATLFNGMQGPVLFFLSFFQEKKFESVVPSPLTLCLICYILVVDCAAPLTSVLNDLARLEPKRKKHNTLECTTLSPLPCRVTIEPSQFSLRMVTCTKLSMLWKLYAKEQQRYVQRPSLRPAEHLIP